MKKTIEEATNLAEMRKILYAKQKRKNIIFWCCWAVIMIIVSSGIITGSYFLSNHEYNEVLNNPPDTNWIEEDLEPIFMTTGVRVLEEDNEGSEIFYTVEANDFYYRVEYSISYAQLFNFRWKYVRYIQINYAESE